jgi:hypothetical protein
MHRKDVYAHCWDSQGQHRIINAVSRMTSRCWSTRLLIWLKNIPELSSLDQEKVRFDFETEGFEMGLPIGHSNKMNLTGNLNDKRPFKVNLEWIQGSYRD